MPTIRIRSVMTFTAVSGAVDLRLHGQFEDAGQLEVEGMAGFPAQSVFENRQVRASRLVMVAIIAM
ncbi:hypothetical protein [Rhodococcus opacus]|uniref:hypothetical protein n=2 Tax=Rhodococcus opacus TaxID=37919 RepID=UPI0017D15614|nr:hypothetical protein [Rhodococcus opacus]MBA8963832.1 hypothetical protein [Rhodococcus opacus]MDV6245762.1 hypothetical protein [Rhodococcus opacus]